MMVSINPQKSCGRKGNKCRGNIYSILKINGCFAPDTTIILYIKIHFVPNEMKFANFPAI